MTEKPEASVLTARRAAQHFRLSSADDACEHLYILIVRSSLGPSPPNAGRYPVASRFRSRSCERGYIFPRAPEQFVASPLCLVGYVRWDARSDRAPPLQTIIFSSFPGRTKACRPSDQKRPYMVRAINKYASPRRLDFGWCNGGISPIIPPCCNFADEQGTHSPRVKSGILRGCKTRALQGQQPEWCADSQ